MNEYEEEIVRLKPKIKITGIRDAQFDKDETGTKRNWYALAVSIVKRKSIESALKIMKIKCD